MDTTRKTFPYLSADAFACPTDRRALENLQRVPLLPKLFDMIAKMSWDRLSYVMNSATSVRVGPEQFPTLYQIHREACETLAVPEPELYVQYSPVVNASTSGLSRTYVVVHSALLDACTNDEIRFVLGHELGHVKSGHVKYLMLAQTLMPLITQLGGMIPGGQKVVELASMALVSGLYEWLRQAEFTCDRAGLLACQDTHAALSAVMKMGCGNSRFSGEMNVDAFLEQARQHTEMAGMDKVNKVLQFLFFTWNLDHPQTVFRARELDAWASGGAYQRILGGDFLMDATGGRQAGPRVRCRNCGKDGLPANQAHCPGCGRNPLGPPSAKEAEVVGGTPCTNCEQPLPPKVTFCPECGHRAGS